MADNGQKLFYFVRGFVRGLSPYIIYIFFILRTNRTIKIYRIIKHEKQGEIGEQNAICALYTREAVEFVRIAKMKESSVEKKLRNGIKALGGVCFKWVSPGQDGVPDRIVVMPGGRIWFVELKQQRGVLAPIQRVQLTRLKDLGFAVRVLYGPDEVAGFLEEVRDGI